MVIYIREIRKIIVSKSRYWKLTSEEVESFTYPEEKLLNWEIKCIREPEEEAIFIGVFQYRYGTPFNYESINGITFYYNHIEKKEVPNITKFLKKKYGGEELEKGERIFLKNSKEIYSAKDIAQLAKEMETNFNTRATITLEFKDISQEEQKQAGLPEAKLLPIPGK